MKRTERKGRRIALLIVCAALALSAAACFAAGALLGRTDKSVKARALHLSLRGDQLLCAR